MCIGRVRIARMMFDYIFKGDSSLGFALLDRFDGAETKALAVIPIEPRHSFKLKAGRSVNSKLP